MKRIFLFLALSILAFNTAIAAQPLDSKGVLKTTDANWFYTKSNLTGNCYKFFVISSTSGYFIGGIDQVDCSQWNTAMERRQVKFVYVKDPNGVCHEAAITAAVRNGNKLGYGGLSGPIECP